MKLPFRIISARRWRELEARLEGLEYLVERCDRRVKKASEHADKIGRYVYMRNETVNELKHRIIGLEKNMAQLERKARERRSL